MKESRETETQRDRETDSSERKRGREREREERDRQRGREGVREESTPAPLPPFLPPLSTSVPLSLLSQAPCLHARTSVALFPRTQTCTRTRERVRSHPHIPSSPAEIAPSRTRHAHARSGYVCLTQIEMLWFRRRRGLQRMRWSGMRQVVSSKETQDKSCLPTCWARWKPLPLVQRHCLRHGAASRPNSRPGPISRDLYCLVVSMLSLSVAP